MKENEDEFAMRLKHLDYIDEAYVQRVSDEIYIYQPFLLSMFTGYRLDVSDAQLGEIMKLFFLIWESFKDETNVRTTRLTEEFYTKLHDRNVEFLKRLERSGEGLGTDDLQGLNRRSRHLLASVLAAFYAKPALRQMKTEKKVAILVGLKTLIQSLEAITLR